ncbi:MAG: amidohydrolase family protein [Dehalococcoidia bacterium]|nr:amidohydrolase family protein [Dehalococcoidia bacterium]
MKIIDFHTHIFPPGIKKDRDTYVKRDALFAELYSNPKAGILTAEELIEAMDSAGVSRAVALNINWLTMDLCRETNDYIMDAIARYPTRLTGFGAVTLSPGEAALKEIERCVKGGIRGLGELRPTWKMLKNENLKLLDDMSHLVAGHNLTILFHASEPVGHLYPGKGNATPGLLYPVISRYPGITFVCAHWGGGLPFYELMPEVSTALKNTFFDTAATRFLYKKEIFQHVAALLGEGKILFGTDYPVISFEKLISEIKGLNLPPPAMESIFHGNAEKLLGI